MVLSLWPNHSSLKWTDSCLCPGPSIRSMPGVSELFIPRQLLFKRELYIPVC